MNIKSIGENNPKNITTIQAKTNSIVTKENTNNQINKSTPVDKLDISPNAQKILNIKNKINEGFYNQDEIIKTTSFRIYQKHLQ